LTLVFLALLYLGLTALQAQGWQAERPTRAIQRAV